MQTAEECQSEACSYKAKGLHMMYEPWVISQMLGLKESKAQLLV